MISPTPWHTRHLPHCVEIIDAKGDLVGVCKNHRDADEIVKHFAIIEYKSNDALREENEDLAEENQTLTNDIDIALSFFRRNDVENALKILDK